MSSLLATSDDMGLQTLSLLQGSCQAPLQDRAIFTSNCLPGHGAANSLFIVSTAGQLPSPTPGQAHMFGKQLPSWEAGSLALQDRLHMCPACWQMAKGSQSAHCGAAESGWARPPSARACAGATLTAPAAAAAWPSGAYEL